MDAYSQVVDDEIVTTVSNRNALPKNWTWPDGSTTSNFRSIDEETLNEAGWFLVTDSEPEFDSETHQLINERIVVADGVPVRTWDVEEIPEPVEPGPAVPSEMQRLQAKADSLQALADAQLTDMLLVFDVLILNGLI